MGHHLDRMLALIGLALLLVATPAAPYARTMSTADAAESAPGLIPLPGGCIGGLPGGDGGPACCIFGYVFIDGQAVEGAQVTITSAHGSKEILTAHGANSPQPYYGARLNVPPLSAQAGETITIAAEYSGHQRTITHVVLDGGQQIDVVLPSTPADDYVFDSSIGQPSAAGKLKYPSSVAVDRAGTVYVADTNNAQVQVFNSSGQFLQQWGILGSQAGQLGRVFGIVVDQQGSVYVADTSNNRIQKFSGAGTWLESWGSQGSGSGEFIDPRGVSVDASGNVYVADTGNQRIQKRDGTTGLWTSWGSQGSGPGQFIDPKGVSVDASGNVYVADTINHRIQKFSGTGTPLDSWGIQGSAAGQFQRPGGVSVDGSGNVYVADTDNQRIQRRNSTTGLWTSWGSYGTGNGQFAFPGGIHVDANGNVYVADTYNHRIQKFSSTGQRLGGWGTKGNDGGTLDFPHGVDVDGNGNIFVADTENHLIKKFHSDGAFEISWGGQGDKPGQFYNPKGVSVDSSGNVYVADRGNNRIQKLDSTTGRWTSWGIQGSGDKQFIEPAGVSVDGSGNVYVADTGNQRIQKLSGAGNYITQWGSPGTGDGQFNNPIGIAVDGSGNVYVADSGNQRIQKFSSTGVSLPWNGPVGGFAPEWVDVDSSGNVYVAEPSNNRIQKFSSTGVPLGVWGGYGSSPLQFSLPQEISVDGSGKIYVADGYNNRIQILRPTLYDQPIATIVQASPRSVVQGDLINLHGMGSDSDTTPEIAAYEWRLDGNIRATTAIATLTTANLSPGPHTISLRVRDTEGTYSAPQTITVIVSESIPNPPETWTFLLYLDGDAGGLAPYLSREPPGALYRLEQGLANTNVQVAALYDGPGDNNSFYYLLKPNGSIEQEQQHKVNMGDPQTLIKFVQWGMQRAPADHYYLALADHANGLDGIAWDFSSAPVDYLSNSDISDALTTITENGAHPIDVLHLDGCLMGLLENAYQVRGLVRYLIASENLAWSAFAYESYRDAVGTHTSPAMLAAAIADRYAQRVGADGLPYTIAALDLSQAGAVASATSTLASELLRFALAGQPNRNLLTSVRAQVQKFDSSGDIIITDNDEYVDLDHWAELIQINVSDSAVRSAAAALRSALQALVVREHHLTGSYLDLDLGLNNARGVAIYYPPRPSATTYQTYVNGDLAFPRDTLWDEFLAAGLAALPFDPTPPAPHPLPTLPFETRLKVYLPTIRR